MTEIHPSSLGRFVRAVAVLTLPAEQQVAYLVSIGVPESVDELALEFEDGRLLAAQFEALGWIRHECIRKIVDLDDLLKRMSGEANAELWTVQALMHSPQWVEVRLLAQELLYSF